MTDLPDAAPAEGDVIQTPTEPTPVDSTTAPADVLRALGFDPQAVQSVILTPTSVVAVAADYPDPPGTEPTPPDDTPTDPEEGEPDASV